MAGKINRKIVLQNGSEYYGCGFGAETDKVCELVFNTSMAGYQALITDPSYAGQAVVMTYPLIGNYGITEDDSVTRAPAVGGIIVREYCDEPSNFSFTKTLAEIMEDNKIPGISGVDTRKLAREIRDCGSVKALITSAEKPGRSALRLSPRPL